MSRMIKFRGRFSKDHPWVYGDYYKYYDGSFMHVITYIDTELMQNTLCPIDEYSLGQFTGLLDKNGKEIYEGDIVNYQYSKDATAYKGEIYYNNKFAAFWIKSGSDSGFALLGQQQVIEIIGNLYENPELLNQ